MTRFAPCLLLAGCFTSAPAPPVANTSKRSVIRPCPVEDTLSSLAATLIGVHDVLGATCVTGRFPRPGYAITARSEVDEPTRSIEYWMLVDADGAIGSREEIELPPGHLGTDQVQAFDFDHDGTDELVSVSSTYRYGYEGKHLKVHRFVAGGWKIAFGRQIEHAPVDATDANRCQASWRLAGYAIVLDPVTTTVTHCPTTHERWVLDAKGEFSRDDQATIGMPAPLGSHYALLRE